MMSEETKKNVARLKRNAKFLASIFKDAPKWYEEAALAAVVVSTTVLPIQLSYKLYYAVSLLLAKNPKHRYAVETMQLFEEKRRGR